MATIKDVAKYAGVSTTTVSHVINKTRFVAEDTTKAVWDAVQALNYSPSAVARSLKSEYDQIYRNDYYHKRSPILRRNCARSGRALLPSRLLAFFVQHAK